MLEASKHGGAALPAAALVPLALLAVAFAIYCLVDLRRAERVRFLSGRGRSSV
jgi:hypothetical protein